ncbi:MAG: acetyl-CoA carboxylase, carboxyltransferase subunit beta [Terracidiphilus sp.]|jgi:acetyl-CoA carboxylase carboxyl transferase subunit beta
MSWFKRENGEFPAAPGGSGPENGADTAEKTVRTEGLWIKCLGCRQTIFKADLDANLNVCPKCQHHFKIGARQRIDLLLEPGYELVDGGLRSTDPLNFTDVKPYKKRLSAAQEATGLDDAILNAVGLLGPHPVVLSAMEYSFIGGSMGAVVGETIARAADRARLGRMPLIVVAASGGARMMEGVVSLMQMAKISTALAQLDDARVPYICVLTDPTTGGVTASFAMLGDLNIAEPGALIGFAGPRVIEQTIRQKLPEGFQRSEFLLEKGFLDAVVPRCLLKSYLIRALDFLKVPAVASEASIGGVAPERPPRQSRRRA